jgi:hypothetical protein
MSDTDNPVCCTCCGDSVLAWLCFAPLADAFTEPQAVSARPAATAPIASFDRILMAVTPRFSRPPGGRRETSTTHLGCGPVAIGLRSRATPAGCGRVLNPGWHAPEDLACAGRAARMEEPDRAGAVAGRRCVLAARSRWARR